jgi:hypothetical protein
VDTKTFQSRKLKAAAGVAKFPRRPAHSLGDPANTTARTADGSHDPTPSNAAEFVAMRLRVDNSHTFRIAGSEAVELTAVIDEVPRYLEALYSARSRIARASKLKSHSLPIAISIANGEIVMSILTPPGKDQESILAMSRGVCNAIAEKWRATGELAKNTVSGVSRSAAVTHPSFSAEGTSESRTGAPPSTDGGLGLGMATRSSLRNPLPHR